MPKLSRERKRDIWTFIITALVAWALWQNYQDNNRTAKQAQQSCQRAQKALPITLAILQRFVEDGTITSTQYKTYSGLIPKECKND